MHWVAGWSLGNLRYLCAAPSPLWLHPGRCLLRKGNHSYSLLRCRRIHLGAALQEGCRQAQLIWVIATPVMAASLIACIEIFHPGEPQLLSQGPLGHQCHGGQEALCVGSYLVLFSSLWSEPHPCIGTKAAACGGRCGSFSPRRNSLGTHSYVPYWVPNSVTVWVQLVGEGASVRSHCSSISPSR